MPTIISNSLLIIFFLFLCLSMHTCIARHLMDIDNGNINASQRNHHFSTKVLERVKHLNIKDVGPILVHEEAGIISHDHENEISGVVDVVEPKVVSVDREISRVPILEPLVSVSGRNNLDERTENFKPYTHVSLLRATSLEGSRRRAQSMVVVYVEHNKQENGPDQSEAHPKQDEDDDDQLQQEDASVTMDYEPPHQKPPIHNRQT